MLAILEICSSLPGAEEIILSANKAKFDFPVGVHREEGGDLEERNTPEYKAKYYIQSLAKTETFPKRKEISYKEANLPTMRTLS
jgi:hypothetical protein